MENIILTDVLAYIDDHIHDRISLGELAELAGYSPFYFSRMFSEAMGMPELRVYRDGMCFKQDYVRGIPQHEISSEAKIHDSGTEIAFKPDKAIFGDAMLSVEKIRKWLNHKTMNLPQLKVQLEYQV